MYKGLINDEENIFVGEEAIEKYRRLHSSPGHVRLLCFTVFTFVKDPLQCHRFSSFLYEMEEKLHTTKCNVFICFRTKLGSDQIARNVFDNLVQPGWLAKKLLVIYKVMNYFKKRFPKLWRTLLPIFKVTRLITMRSNTIMLRLFCCSCC